MFANCHYAWSLRKSGEPRGVVFGVDAGLTILIGDMVWHPKATAREKLELGAAFFKELKKREMIVICRAEYKYKSFYERFARDHILRRVGTLFDIPVKGERMMEFQV